MGVSKLVPYTQTDARTDRWTCYIYTSARIEDEAMIVLYALFLFLTELVGGVDWVVPHYLPR